MVIYKDGYAIGHGGILRPVVKCKWCGDQTTNTRTKECDRHWELRTRVQSEPELAARMIACLETTDA